MSPSTSLQFTVYGRPQQKGSKRVVPLRNANRPFAVVEDNPRAKSWAQQVSYAAAEARAATGEAQAPLIREGVMVRLLFYFARPKGHYGTGRNAAVLKASAPPLMVSMPDVDKLARCTLDALTGVVFADDAQIVRLMAGKDYGEPERVEVDLRVLGAASSGEVA